MDTQQIVEAFRRLPVDERARLVEELWDEVARELEQRPLSEAQRRLLDERIRQHDEMPRGVGAGETARDDILRDLCPTDWLSGGKPRRTSGRPPNGMKGSASASAALSCNRSTPFSIVFA